MERFTDRARKVVQLAKQECQRFNHEYLGTEHLLLGLLKEGSGIAATTLLNLKVDLKVVRAEVEKLMQAGPEIPLALDKLPWTPRARKVIELAEDESKLLEHGYVGTEHLLLGLVREQEGVAAQVLANLGVTPEKVREGVVQLLDSKAQDNTLIPEIVFAIKRYNEEAWRRIDERVRQVTREEYQKLGKPTASVAAMASSDVKLSTAMNVLGICVAGGTAFDSLKQSAISIINEHLKS